MLIALGVGIVWLILVHLIPRPMVKVAIVLSIIILVVGGLLLFIDQTPGWEGNTFWKILIGIVLLAFAILFSLFFCFYRLRIGLTAIFLDWSRQFLREKLITLAYIPIFIAFTLGLIILCVFQYLAFLSHNEPQPDQDGIYLALQGNSFLVALTVI